MKKLLFLDIDGVLNCKEAYTSGFCKYTQEHTEHSWQAFYPPSKLLLNKLIEEFSLEIIISSTWRSRGLEEMKLIWQSERMSGNIIDVTPNFRFIDFKGYHIPRGCEIAAYLEKLKFMHINWSKESQLEWMQKANLDNYIILDDDSDMLFEQRNHFIHIKQSPENKQGFNEKYYLEAYNKISKNIIELNYL